MSLLLETDMQIRQSVRYRHLSEVTVGEYCAIFFEGMQVGKVIHKTKTRCRVQLMNGFKLQFPIGYVPTAESCNDMTHYIENAVDYEFP